MITYMQVKTLMELQKSSAGGDKKLINLNAKISCIKRSRHSNRAVNFANYEEKYFTQSKLWYALIRYD